MTDDNRQPDIFNTTYDLRHHAAEALRRYEESLREQLVDDNADSQTITVSYPTTDTTTADLHLAAKDAQHRADSIPDDTGYFDDNTVLQLYILEATFPIEVNIRGEITIGRSDNRSDYQPDIDMAQYGAHRLGLSRRHACLRRCNNQLQLIDSGSRNGSQLNGRVVQPDTPVQLHHGDKLQLGNLSMLVQFYRKPTP